MIPKNELDAVLNAAVQAPSGHNYQPWKFKISGDQISFFNAPENDATVYNFKQRGSFIAHGAAAENALSALEHAGYGGVVSVEPSGEFVLRISALGENPTGRAGLFESIAKRSSNRKAFRKERVSDLAELARLPNDLSGLGKVVFVEDPKAIASAASAFSVNDWLIFNARVVHQALFPHIVWTAKEEEEKKDGLFIDTLELPPPVKMLFGIFKHWPVARLLGSIGFGSLVAAQNRDTLYTQTPALGAVLVPDLSPKNLVSAGRMLEYVWLSAIKKGLSLQMVMGAYYLALRAEDETEIDLTETQKLKLADAKNSLIETFKSGSLIPAVFFRIGKSEPPSARSSKKAPVVEI